MTELFKVIDGYTVDIYKWMQPPLLKASCSLQSHKSQAKWWIGSVFFCILLCEETVLNLLVSLRACRGLSPWDIAQCRHLSSGQSLEPWGCLWYQWSGTLPAC